MLKTESCKVSCRAPLRKDLKLGTSDTALTQRPDREREPDAIPAHSGAAIAITDKERLRESEQRFRAAIDAVEGILWTNNAAGEMEGEQPGWAALTGQTYDEYQGYGWSRAVHPDDTQPTIDAWKAAVAERRTFVFEHRVRRRDGQWRLFSIRAVPTFDANGRPSRMGRRPHRYYGSASQ